MLRVCLLPLFFIGMITSCGQSSDNLLKPFHLIEGRDNGEPPFHRLPVYRAYEMPNWKRVKQTDTSNYDTRKPIAKYEIATSGGTVFVTVHNFPIRDQSKKVLLQAQLNRWKGQFSSIDEMSEKTMPQAFSGFSGFYFEAAGVMGDEKKMILSWALQIDPLLSPCLEIPENKDDEELFCQMRADITIKAYGTEQGVKEAKNAIIQFARSFELIREIPWD